MCVIYYIYRYVEDNIYFIYMRYILYYMSYIYYTYFMNILTKLIS